MLLTDEQILRFQSLYEKRFSHSISRDEARERFTNLIELVRLVYRPIPKEDFERLTNQNMTITQYDHRQHND